jgi:hypothetical protein
MKMTSPPAARLESTTSSPVYAHFSSTLSGCVTIRAFDEVEQFSRTNAALLDTNTAAGWVQRNMMWCLQPPGGAGVMNAPPCLIL